MRRYLPGILLASLVVLTVAYGIVVIRERRSLARQPVSVAVRSTDPSRGNANAPVTIVMFGDFQCEACRDFEPTLTDVERQYGDRVRVVWKDFPLAVQHAAAQEAAEAARCAQDQGKFWEMHDALYANIDRLSERPFASLAEQIGLNATTFATCLERGLARARVQENVSDGEAIGVFATPTVIVNSLRFSGIPTTTDLVSAVEQVLRS